MDSLILPFGGVITGLKWVIAPAVPPCAASARWRHVRSPRWRSGPPIRRSRRPDHSSVTARSCRLPGSVSSLADAARSAGRQDGLIFLNSQGAAGVERAKRVAYRNLALVEVLGALGIHRTDLAPRWSDEDPPLVAAPRVTRRRFGGNSPRPRRDLSPSPRGHAPVARPAPPVGAAGEVGPDPGGRDGVPA